MSDNKKMLIVFCVILILGGCIGFAIRTWAIPKSSKYGTIEEVVKKVKADSVYYSKFRDSIFKINAVLRNRAKYIKQQKQSEDAQIKKLSSRPLSPSQRDSLERAIFGEIGIPRLAQ